MKDDLNIAQPEDLKKCRKQALKLREHGSLEGRVAIRVDHRTIIFKKVKHNGTK